ncbi:glycosyltransferase family 2 protein [Sulfurihydrogenibium azorense]|uniref:glycosyltransferase family 2 protein n=1 Tax=Sulfurihydrogenibium azorense TaxID=309806 RepID=UPI002409890E|nr:glycosyltransferase family 2 protein [Sulfurihydrogenibium azorense]MDM7273531.1 glycosyltransferase family 2 protein [Sulfurihydrogenibium azorense]
MNTKLKVKLLEDRFLGADGKILPDYKFNINLPELKIQNSKLIKKPEDKYETTLFLLEGEGRKEEGGLRTKGYFKFSYVWNEGKWWITDLEGNPTMTAPKELEEDINNFINTYLDYYEKNVPFDLKLKIQNKKKSIHPYITNLPLITVILATFNAEEHLEKALQSVINQIYPNIEYIIIDGGSTDGTIDIIKKYEDFIDYWVSEKDEGIYDAMNKGIICSLGDYLYFLGSDDEVILETVFSSIFIEEIDNIKNSKLIYGNAIFRDSAEIYDGKFLSYKLRFKNLCHQATFYKSELFRTYGLYNTKYKIWADYERNIRFWKVSNPKYLNKAIAVYRRSGVSSSVEIDKDFLSDYEYIMSWIGS